MASGFIGALVGSFGFRTTFSVSFERILPAPAASALAGPSESGLPPLATVPQPTIVPVSRSFFEADIRVMMPSTATANFFELAIYGLGNDVFRLLDPQTTIVDISLGYADGSSS